MKNVILLSLFVSCCLLTFSQESVSPEYENALRNGLMGFEYRNSAVRYNGNQYFNSWTKGDVELENGDVITGIFLRYDQYMDELLWLRETDFKTGVLPRGDIRGFVIYNDQHDILAEFSRRKIKLPYKADSSETFLQILVKGNFELFAYRKLMQSANDYRLVDDTRYVLFHNGISYFIGTGKRHLMKIPGIDEAKLKAVLKSNKINLDGSENSLLQVIDLYNKSNSNGTLTTKT